MIEAMVMIEILNRKKMIAHDRMDSMNKDKESVFMIFVPQLRTICS
jgi:hypothetical protein